MYIKNSAYEKMCLNVVELMELLNVIHRIIVTGLQHEKRGYGGSYIYRLYCLNIFIGTKTQIYSVMDSFDITAHHATLHFHYATPYGTHCI